MTRRRYSREFKIKAVRLAETSDKSFVDVAQELGFHQNTLYLWRRRTMAEGLVFRFRASDTYWGED